MTSYIENATYSLADFSAIQRDLLWVLSQTDPSESDSLYYVLTDYYPNGVDYIRICTILKGLIERDLVTKQTNDTNQYQLTAARRALSAQQAWQAGTNNAEANK